MGGVTNAVLEFSKRVSFRELPAEVIHQGKRCLQDGIGVILAGSTEECSAILRRQLVGYGGGAEAAVFGCEALRAPTSLAARANATAGHAMDFDDTQLSSSPDRIFGLLTHPTMAPLAAALAVGERLAVSGAKFLEAFLVGFEVECKIAEAIHPAHYQKGFHSSGTVGTFGAAVAAARLMDLDRSQLEMAIGIATSLTSGIRISFGTMAKPLQLGRAAENGVVAAELAANGFTGGKQALDGPWGFFSVFGGGVDTDRIVGALGNPYSVVEPGVSVKPYPCGSLAHPSMDAMLKLMLEYDVKAGEIEAIVLRAGSNILDPLRYAFPENALEAKFSLPFVLSSMALCRKAGIAEFTDAFVCSEPVRGMMRKVKVMRDPDIEAQGFEKMRSVVGVHLQDGRRLERSAEKYRGGPDRPLTQDELRQKFNDCAGLALAEKRVATAIEQIESIDLLGSIVELTETLTDSREATSP